MFLVFLFYISFTINSWLAVFNLIPVWGLDGEAILQNNRKLFFILIISAGLLMFVGGRFAASLMG
jgi:Zn-dependent protease